VGRFTGWICLQEGLPNGIRARSQFSFFAPIGANPSS